MYNTTLCMLEVAAAMCVTMSNSLLQILIIEGETGSGKTTQIPQYLYEAVSPFKIEYRIAQGLNFRVFREFMKTAKFMLHDNFYRMLLVALGGLC